MCLVFESPNSVRLSVCLVSTLATSTGRLLSWTTLGQHLRFDIDSILEATGFPPPSCPSQLSWLEQLAPPSMSAGFSHRGVSPSEEVRILVSGITPKSIQPKFPSGDLVDLA
uniref:Uncharacterized protein n=1 Tax=Timema tahoe TaxID=61484 RepID=A0A7R9IN96_9NEOP|nr:unnamed protein product [Timema tahoe]